MLTPNDRYGTGNMAFGNFDFDPVYYPTPAEFIANLTAYGFDFQVWVANRAFEQTELYNTSIANGWLFPNQEPAQGGPALNLSIPEAYKYFKQRLSFFPNLGVKGYKIDRGEEGEMPGLFTIVRWFALTSSDDIRSIRTEHTNVIIRAALL